MLGDLGGSPSGTNTATQPKLANLRQYCHFPLGLAELLGKTSLKFFFSIITEIAWETSLGKTKQACVSIYICFPRDLSLETQFFGSGFLLLLFFFFNLFIKLEEGHGWPWEARAPFSVK